MEIVIYHMGEKGLDKRLVIRKMANVGHVLDKVSRKVWVKDDILQHVSQIDWTIRVISF